MKTSLDFGLHVLDRVAGFHVERDGLASEGLDEDLHFEVCWVKYLVLKVCLALVICAFCCRLWVVPFSCGAPRKKFHTQRGSTRFLN